MPAQAKIVEIALRHVAMPDDGEILSVQVLSVEKQLEKRKRAAEEAGSVIDVSAKKVGTYLKSCLAFEGSIVVG